MCFVRLLPSVGMIGLLFTTPAFAQKKPAVPDEPVEVTPETPTPTAESRKEAQQKSDQKTLEEAGLSTGDTAGLIAYLKSRTLSPEQIDKIMTLVGKMNADAPFDDRVAAQEQLLKMGGLAADVLKKQAKENPDPEVQYRSFDTLRRLELQKKYAGDVTEAVVRALGKSRSEQAAAALFAYLPLADSTQLVDLIQDAMTATAGANGQPNKLLVEALENPDPVLRRVAAVALASGGTAEKRVRFEGVLPKLLEIARSDKEHEVRFALAKALLLDARQKVAVGVIIDLLPGMTRGQSWQAEELLAQVAKATGITAPEERCQHAGDPNDPSKETTASKESRAKARDAWNKWWATASAKVDLNVADVKLTVLGELVLVTTTWANQQQVMITEYGADEKEKTRTQFANPNGNLFDAIVREDGSVLTLDYYVNQLQARDLSGKVLKGWTVLDKNQQRFGFQAKGLVEQPDGNVIVIHQNGFKEFDKGGKPVLTYTRPEVNKNQMPNDLCGVVKMTSGEYVVLVFSPNQQQGELIVLDKTGKTIADRKAIQVPNQPYYRNSLIQSGDNKVMMFDQQNARMQEYDLKTGKAVDGGKRWQRVSSPMSIQRLPNGNILMADSGYGKVVERTPDGTEVWSMNARDNFGNTQLVRAYVR